MAVKNTSSIIPFCHPMLIEGKSDVLPMFSLGSLSWLITWHRVAGCKINVTHRLRADDDVTMEDSLLDDDSGKQVPGKHMIRKGNASSRHGSSCFLHLSAFHCKQPYDFHVTALGQR